MRLYNSFPLAGKYLLKKHVQAVWICLVVVINLKTDFCLNYEAKHMKDFH